MKNHIKQLIRQGEGQCLDFKFCISDSKKIARTLAAFSNSEGGRLLIGVKDNGAITGVQSDEEFYMVQAAAQMYCRPEIRFESQNWEVNGKTVLEVIVPKSEKKPHFAPDDNDNWKVYIRSGDQNFIGNTVLIKSWKARKRSSGTLVKFTKKEKILLDYLAKNGSISLSGYRKLAGIPRFLAEKILVNFIVLEIIAMDFTEKGIFYRLTKPEGITLSAPDTK
ncbi:MAG: ATP-binding protein [Bacteroidales bacterium]|nr:MAG: ATP-binding protein [Bacteroidales bacterium]